MLRHYHHQDLKYLRIKFKVAAAVSKQVDFSLHLLVLIQSSLLFPMIIEENGKVQVDQRIRTGIKESIKTTQIHIQFCMHYT